MSKYYISVDCEGVACGVGAPGQALGDGKNYNFSALEASREANAAASALFDAGAEEVIVWDSHGTGVNLDYDALDPRVKILLGSGHRGRFAGIDESFDGVLFIGYHAKEGTGGATLAHTFSSKTFQYIKINGKELGELEIDAAYAGKKGVPVLFCSSDDKCVAQAKAAFGDIASVVTKQSLSWSSAISRHPKAVCGDIYSAVAAAVNSPKVKPYVIDGEVEAEIRYQRMDFAASASLFDKNGRPFEAVDAYTRRGRINDITDLF